MGRKVDIKSGGSPVLAELWLDSVEKIECTEPSSAPPNRGHYLAATFVLRTSEQFEPDWGWWINARDFATHDDEGTETGHGVRASCLPERRYLADRYLADAGYYGVVLIDSASEHGTLSYRPRSEVQEFAGWRWEY